MKIKEAKKPQPIREFLDSPALKRLLRPLFLLCVVCAVLAPGFFLGVGVMVRPRMEEEAHKYLADKGFVVNFKEEGIRASLEELWSAIRRPKQATAEPDVLDLSLKFKDLFKIYSKREEAMKRGLLFSSGDDYVSAKIKSDGKKIKAKVRLKGDQTDHMEGDKWSYRIKVKGKDHFKGMRVFSIQHPKTRNYHFEKLALDHFRSHGVLAPRYDFVRVVQNGEDKGIYGMEEHFSKELLESQARREGPILRMDDGLIWQNLASVTSPLYHFKGNPVETFRTGQLEESPALRKARDTAIGLYRGYVMGKVSVEEAFDLDQTAKFLALCELWDSWHALWMGNMRFYYNPISGKLSPIAYDLKVETPRAGGPLLNYYSVTFKVFFPYTEGKLGELFFAYLRKYSQEILSPGFSEQLRKKEERALSALQLDYPWVRSYPVEKLKRRAAQLMQAGPENKGKMMRMGPITPDTEFTTPLLAYEVSPGRLELHNLLPFEFEIFKIELLLPSGATLTLKEDSFKIPSTPIGKAPSRAFVDLEPERKPVNVQAPLEYRIWGRIPGKERKFSVLSRRYFPEREKTALPAQNLNELLEKYDFFEYFPEQALLRVRPGEHLLDDSVSLPEGVALEIKGATELKLPKDGMIIVRGPMTAQGTAKAPVRILGRDGESWRGIAVLAGGKGSVLRHAHFINTTGVETEDWTLTGGVNFYRSPVICEFCRFDGTLAEDALNIISSKFFLKSPVINSTVSDAFDGDFSQGVIDGGEVYEVGGDGIDFSGSKILAQGLRFNNIHDKAISAGESSELLVRNVTIERSSAGIVSKDRSRVTAENVALKEIRHFGLMAYTKKPEFGPAELGAKAISFSNVANKTVRQRGSQLQLDGRDSLERDINVKQLYKKGFMKK